MGGVVLDVLLEDFLVGADDSAAVDEAGGVLVTSMALPSAMLCRTKS